MRRVLPVRGSGRTAALLLVASLGGGCAISYGFSAGPMVDTEGTIGFQLGAHASFGVAFDEQNGLQEVIGVAGSPPGIAAPHVTPYVGLDYVWESDDDSLGVRVGLRSRFQLSWDETFHAWIGAGGALAILPELAVDDNDSNEYTHLGVELEGYYLGDENAEVPEGEDGPDIGLFGVSLIYEEMWLDEDPFEDTWD